MKFTPAQLSSKDPAFRALIEVVQALDGFDRQQQLRTLAAAALMLGNFEHAKAFIAAAEASEPNGGSDG